MFDLKIFQVTPYYPPHVGGVESFVQLLSEGLASRGHEVTVFASSNSHAQSVRKVNGVKIISLKTVSKVYNVPIVPSLFSRLLHEGTPDVIHAHQYPVFMSDVSAAAAIVKNIPMLLHVHLVPDSKSALSGWINNFYYSTMGLFTLKSADGVVVPSFAYKSKIEKMRVNPEKIQVVPIGIDFERFQIKTDKESFKERYHCQGSKVILSVSRLNYQKGLQYLIRAMPAVLKKVPNAKLMIVGEGEEFSYLNDLSKSLGISQSVIFTGVLSHEEIPVAYSSSDVFVLPSLFENTPLTLIEAQASGKPVISTRVGGVPEVLVDGETGFLVEPRNVKQLEVRIVDLLSDNNLAHEMGEKGKKFVSTRFGISNIVPSFLKAYEKLLQN